MAYRLQKIEEHQLADHYYLSAEDTCYYFGEFTARGGYSAGEINQLIFNYKDPRANARYRAKAVSKVGHLVGNIGNIADYTVVPIPPSKSKTDAEYDGRLCESLEITKTLVPELDFKEVVSQKESMTASHIAGVRPKPEELKSNYECDTDLLDQCQKNIIVFDDMLTAGAHFRAMSDLLKEGRSDLEVIGLFVSRRITDPATMFTEFTE
jgi:predicted amidophosphoribosyltransferase